jgi:hypothetical protein
MTQELTKKPKVSNSYAERELDKAEQQFNNFDEQVKAMTMDRMNEAPREETEPQTKLSNREILKNNDIYLKPKSTIFAVDPKTGVAQKFNENFREEYNFQKEYVNFIFENNELKGETTSIWTRPFGGVPAEEWLVPANKPVWGPRYLAEQIKRKYYHRLVMKENNMTGTDGMGQYYGTMAADTTIQRIDARPVSSRKSIFMGSGSF